MTSSSDRPTSSPGDAPGKHAKKERIIDAALTVFIEKGYHAATIDEIAERAGVAKGTIYLYFDSKAALMEELLETTVRTHLAAAQARIGSVDGALARLRALVEVDVAYLRQHQPLARVLMSGEALGLSPDFRCQMSKAQREVKQLILGVIRQGQTEGVFRDSLDPEAVASALLGLRFGILQEWLESPYGDPPEDAFETAFDLVLHGLMSP